MKSKQFQRRDFIRTAATAAGALAAERFLSGAQTPPDAHVPTRALGRTGERVSSIGLGGYHI